MRRWSASTRGCAARGSPRSRQSVHSRIGSRPNGRTPLSYHPSYLAPLGARCGSAPENVLSRSNARPLLRGWAGRHMQRLRLQAPEDMRPNSTQPLIAPAFARRWEARCCALPAHVALVITSLMAGAADRRAAVAAASPRPLTTNWPLPPDPSSYARRIGSARGGAAAACRAHRNPFHRCNALNPTPSQH